jgi:hypothetical protein
VLVSGKRKRRASALKRAAEEVDVLLGDSDVASDANTGGAGQRRRGAPALLAR